MMLGNLCTRRCGFCAVPKGRPAPIDHDEPRRVAFAVAQLGIEHAVVTSVNRDDDNLGAATAFVNVITEIRRQAPGCQVEVLTPDFQGVDTALRMVVAAAPEILNHNIETVPRLYRVAKSGGRYERSLAFLANAKTIAAELGPDIVTGRKATIVTRPASSSAWAKRCTSSSGSFETSPTATSISSRSASISAPRATTFPWRVFYNPRGVRVSQARGPRHGLPPR